MVTSEYKAKIQQTADNLQITLYIRDDGTVHQRPPGEPVIPDPKAGPQTNHGHEAGPKAEEAKPG